MRDARSLLSIRQTSTGDLLTLSMRVVDGGTGPVFEFEDSRERSEDGRRVALRVRTSPGSLDALLAELERLVAPVAPPVSAPVPAPVDAGDRQERFAACLAIMIERGELGDLPFRQNCEQIAEWCSNAGVEYEQLFVPPTSAEADGGRQQAITRQYRWVCLHRAVRTSGYTRTLVSAFSPGTESPPESRFGVRFMERYECPGGPEKPYEFGVDAAYASLPALVSVMERRAGLAVAADVPSAHSEGDEVGRELEDRLVKAYATLIAHGRFGDELRPGEIRDEVVSWWAEAGIPLKHEGGSRHCELVSVSRPEADQVFTLALEFWINMPAAHIAFEEEYRLRDDPDDSCSYEVQAPLASLDALVAYFEQHLGIGIVADAALDPQDRLIACFEALVARGELGDALARQENRARVAAWFAEAGAQVTMFGFDRGETLLRVYRSNSDCVFKLRLSIDRGDYKPGIRFDEFYDYLPRYGDDGREYAYSVRTGLSSLGRLVRFFGARLDEPASTPEKPAELGGGAGDRYVPDHQLEDRLVRHFRQLVARGELGDTLPLRENRDRVAAWFDEAGVSAEPDDWSWFNS